MELKIQQLHNQAIDAALNHDWDKAISYNLAVLDISPRNIDAMLGLGYAYLQSGDLKKAKESYKKALNQDPINIIARNNLDKVEILEKKGGKVEKVDRSDIILNPDSFMHAKGKTRMIPLMNIGQADVLAALKVGEIVYFKNKKRHLEVRNKKGDYIGCLPDDMSKRLIFFLDAKSEYEAIMKESTKSSVEIFVREVKKGAKVKNFVSFPDNIQEDMKRIIGKDGDEENVERIDMTEDDDSELDDEEAHELERLAQVIDGTNMDDEDEDTTYLSELDDEDDEDEDEEDI